MTTGRINQVAILGHTSGPGATCSDSTLSARLRGRAPPTGLPDPRRTRGARGTMEGPRRSRATARPLTGAERPSTGWGAIVRHRVPAATKGVAGHAPPHRVPLQRNPPTLGRTAQCKLPHGSTPLTWDTSGQKNVGGWSRSGGHRRPAPSRERGSASRERADGAATLPTPSSSSCMQHPGVGPRRDTEATANAAPPSRAEHRPVKSHAPHRRGQARRVGRSPVPARHTRVRDPPYRYKPHMVSRRAKTRRLP